MKERNKDIFCTLGPSSMTKNFLKNARKLKINLLRINLSHIEINQLNSLIKFIRKFTKVPICIDTEGAQIRSKVLKKSFYKKNKNLIIYKDKGNFKLYPDEIFFKIKSKDILDIGFSGLIIKVEKKTQNKLLCKVIREGFLETNKGIHIKNRKIKINFLTKKDFEAIKIGKKNNIKFYALSFTNNEKDVVNFNKILKNETKIYKLETKQALKNLKKIFKKGSNFLIDRGDLSKDISIEYIPLAQRKILKLGNKLKKKIYVATNFLESMIENPIPTRGEVNDIYSTLELGAKGLVLAAETAIGKYPVESVLIVKKIIEVFKSKKNI